MSYEQQKITPLPCPKVSNYIQQAIWQYLPDLWGDCASARSKKKRQRQAMETILTEMIRLHDELVMKGEGSEETLKGIQSDTSPTINSIYEAIQKAR